MDVYFPPFRITFRTSSVVIIVLAKASLLSFCPQASLISYLFWSQIEWSDLHWNRFLFSLLSLWQHTFPIRGQLLGVVLRPSEVNWFVLHSLALSRLCTHMLAHIPTAKGRGFSRTRWRGSWKAHMTGLLLGMRWRGWQVYTHMQTEAHTRGHTKWMQNDHAAIKSAGHGEHLDLNEAANAF